MSHELTPSEIRMALARKLAEKVRTDPFLASIQEISIFGSTARNEARHTSDLDILAILPESGTGGALFRDVCNKIREYAADLGLMVIYDLPLVAPEEINPDGIILDLQPYPVTMQEARVRNPNYQFFQEVAEEQIILLQR